MNFVFVGLGGAIGALLRYGISLIPYGDGFPVLTLITNVLGAIIIGFISGYSSGNHISPYLLLFLKTGVCGGFTTFSTFSLEAYTLYQHGENIAACIYAVSSVMLCLAGIGLGLFLAQLVIK